MSPEERRPSERGRMEDALRESEGRLSAILQNTPAVVYLMTPDSRFIHINRRFEELFDLKNEDVVPDVLVSDIGMPRENGYALINRVRERDRAGGRHTPALALTGYVRRADREKALLAGFDAHVAKPVEPHALTGAVAKLAARPVGSGPQ